MPFRDALDFHLRPHDGDAPIDLTVARSIWRMRPGVSFMMRAASSTL
jgi:hypothetical protein